jgi:hypothetical protein
MRKYKMKLKEWKFDKNLPSKNMRIVLAKASKRAAEEDKETVFYSSGQEINADRIENFKKRMKLDRVGIAPLSAGKSYQGAFWGNRIKILTFSKPHPQISHIIRHARTTIPL